MAVLIENLQDKVCVTDWHESLLRKVEKRCLEFEEFKLEVETGVMLVDDERIRELNKEYRGKDVPTDVLSFPMLEIKNGELLEEVHEFDMDEGKLLLGDIAISLETALKQADEYGHSFERELCFLLTHGMYHLLGYDHETPEDEARMMERQEAVLKELGLGR